MDYYLATREIRIVVKEGAYSINIMQLLWYDGTEEVRASRSQSKSIRMNLSANYNNCLVLHCAHAIYNKLLSCQQNCWLGLLSTI